MKQNSSFQSREFGRALVIRKSSKFIVNPTVFRADEKRASVFNWQDPTDFESDKSPKQVQLTKLWTTNNESGCIVSAQTCSCYLKLKRDHSVAIVRSLAVWASDRQQKRSNHVQRFTYELQRAIAFIDRLTSHSHADRKARTQKTKGTKVNWFEVNWFEYVRSQIE